MKKYVRQAKYLLIMFLLQMAFFALPMAGMTAHAASAGGLTVTGGTDGTDYSYDETKHQLIVKTDTALTLSGKDNAMQIYIESGVDANLTLNDIFINRYENNKQSMNSEAAVVIEDDSPATVTLTIKGTNGYLGGINAPAIQKNGDQGKLIFKGSTTSKIQIETVAYLTACHGAAIGGSAGKNGANIQFESGRYDVTSFTSGAAIGGGNGAAGKNIVINGGTINAYLQSLSGYTLDQQFGAAIGGGYEGNGENITINGGTVTADVKGKDTSSSGRGAAIGGGSCKDSIDNVNKGVGRNIVINGGTVTATAYHSAAIGGGLNSNGGSSITINGGFITATSTNAAAIGSGQTATEVDTATVGTADSKVTITGGTVTAKNGDASPAIGVGDAGSSKVYISGGSVNATGGPHTAIDSDYTADNIGLSAFAKKLNGPSGSKYTSTLTYSETDSEDVELFKYQVPGITKITSVTPYLLYKGEYYKDYGIKDLQTDSNGYLYLYFKKSIVNDITVGVLGADDCLQEFTVSLNKDGSLWKDAGEVTLQPENNPNQYDVTKEDGKYTFKGIFKKGTYDICVDGKPTGRKITLGEEAASDQTLNYYSVTINQPENGKITGENTALEGVDYTFTVTPDAGYSVSEASYTIGGTEKTLKDKYTIPGEEITGPVALSAVIIDGRGTPVDLSGVTWNYEGPYYYKNEPYTVTLKNLPEGVDETQIVYENNSKSEVGTYTATATCTAKAGYYITEQPSSLDWEIKEYAPTDITLQYNGETTKQEWYNKNVTVTAEGYTMSESLTGSFVPSVTFDATGSKTLYFKNDAGGYITTTGRTVTVNIDKTAPTGTITLDGATYSTLNENSVEQRCHMQNRKAEFTGEDTQSGIEKIQYAVSGDCYRAAGDLEKLEWQLGNSYEVKADTRQAVYVKLQDKAGNVSYLSTPIIYDDTVAPATQGEPEITDKTDTGAVCSVSFDGICYYDYVVLLSGETAPADAADIKKAAAAEGGIGGSGQAAEARIELKELKPNKDYTLYMILNDGLKTLSGTDNPNRSGIISVPFTTEMSKVKVTDQELYIKAESDVDSYTYDLSRMVSGLDISQMTTIGYEIKIEKNGPIFSQYPSVNGNLLTIPVRTGLAADVSQEIQITFSIQDYVVVTAVLTVKTVSKTPATLSGVTVTDTVYNGEPHGVTGTPQWKAGDTVVTGGTTGIVYTGIDNNYSGITPPINAGTYKVTYTIEHSDYVGIWLATYEIKKAEVSGMENVQWYVDNDSEPYDLQTSEIYADGKEHTICVKGYPSNVKPEYSGVYKASAAGEYTAYVDFVLSGGDSKNYNQPSRRQISWKIKEKPMDVTKQKPDMSNVHWEYEQEGVSKEIKDNDNLPANGKLYTVKLAGVPEGVECIYSGDYVETKAGKYLAIVEFEVDSAIYEEPDPGRMELNWNIVESGSGEEEKGENPDNPTPDNPTQDNPTQDNPTQDNPTSGNPGNTAPSGNNSQKSEPNTEAVDIPAVGATEEYAGQKYKVVTATAQGGTVEYDQADGSQTKVVIPDQITIGGQSYKVTAIAKNAFKANSKKLKSVKLGNEIKQIPSNCFSGCSKLTSVTIGKNVTKIGAKAFYKCTSLKKITIPDNVSVMEKQCFSGCKKLKNITIKSKNLKKVGSKAIKGIAPKATIKCKDKKTAAKYKKLFKSSTGYVKTMHIK